tara:strand:- start:95 stop:385 length:291 start_codon:yes stop_codon:yes gene_type:complete
MSINNRLKKLEGIEKENEDISMFSTIYENHPDGPKTLGLQMMEFVGGDGLLKDSIWRSNFPNNTAFMLAVDAAHLKIMGTPFDWGDDITFYDKDEV